MPQTAVASFLKLLFNDFRLRSARAVIFYYVFYKLLKAKATNVLTNDYIIFISYRNTHPCSIVKVQ